MLINEHSDHARRLLPGVGYLPGAGFLNDRLNDAVGLLSALPEISAALRSIQVHIENLDNEVIEMRQGVNRLEAEVHGLRGEIEGLRNGMGEVGESVSRLEPHIADISRIARPLKRRRSRVAVVGTNGVSAITDAEALTEPDGLDVTPGADGSALAKIA